MLLGIDLGGTTINLGLFDDGKLIRKECVPSFEPGASLGETLEYLSDRISEIITPSTTHIGIGVPTLVDPVNGIVYNATNIESWRKVHLKDWLTERFKVKVSVNNDANCFVLGAAATLGTLDKITVGVTLGTGTGIGILHNGNLFSGENCGAGELCSVPYNGKDYESFCSKKFFTEEGWTGYEASEAAAKSDPMALGFFEDFGNHLGNLLALVMYAYDPACIAIGGGLANCSRWFSDSMMLTLRNAYIYPHVLDKLQIEFLPQGDVPLLGASLL